MLNERIFLLITEYEKKSVSITDIKAGDVFEIWDLEKEERTFVGKYTAETEPYVEYNKSVGRKVWTIGVN